MELTIQISEEAAAILSERAQRAGEGVAQYAAGMVERLTEGPRSLQSISGPLAEQFQDSGMSDDELGDLLENATHAVRRGAPLDER